MAPANMAWPEMPVKFSQQPPRCQWACIHFAVHAPDRNQRSGHQQLHLTEAGEQRPVLKICERKWHLAPVEYA
jgi:hypothetical protein